MRTILAALVIASSLFPAKASAKPCQLLEEVLGQLYAPQNRQKFMVWKPGDGNSLQVVFINRGKRYTFWYSGDAESASPPNFLSVWVRPNGTSGQDFIQTFTDKALDGLVNFGIGGPLGAPPSVTKLFNDGAIAGHQEGLEYREYWQDQYDDAIRAFRAYLFKKR